ncbi:DUF742 domain-containing protein [Saccharopolyspora rosea]|uniref:DUF742 domain-containing protein n=1 Tax=Saccharopolyspora rosea TaxID=524884 RepID=A0ABW3G340_9PSEU|nr:DUF742 domain-containing protein [Saccharopolyspora rosea]
MSTPEVPRGSRVRAYALTGGRTATGEGLDADALVSTPGYDSGVAAELLPEPRAIYERARRPVTLASLVTELGIPMGVLRVLVGDLATDGVLFVHPPDAAQRHDHGILQRVLDGLNRLSP